MGNRNERKLVWVQSALAMAMLLAFAVAGSSGALAQTTTLRAPGSSLKPATLPTSGFSNTTPLAAPAAHLNTQTVPAIANPNVRVGATTGEAKAYVLKAQVVPGAAMNATQKLATAKAALAEIEKQAKEQQDKETEAKIAQLKSTLSIGNSATLSVLSPKSPIGNASLDLGRTSWVDFERNKVAFNEGLKAANANLTGYSKARCVFTVPEDGFYMVAFTVEDLRTFGPAVNVTTQFGPLNLSKNAAISTLGRGTNMVVVVKDFNKGAAAYSEISSDDTFYFNSCEFSRLK